MRLLHPVSERLRELFGGRNSQTESQTGGPSEERRRALGELEEQFGYRFGDLELLDRALTHRSFLHDAGNQQGRGDYEALEFFGDTVVGMVISEELLCSHPQLREGDLSKLKSYLVSTRQLSKLSRSLDLSRYLLLSHGEEKTGGRQKRAILADIFESVTAAIYLDGGLDAARTFVLAQFQEALEQIGTQPQLTRDYKSTLQEELHGSGKSEPLYRVVEESGPDHRKHFRVEVVSEGRSLAQGEGLSKKEAEQEAARLALELFEESPSCGRNQRPDSDV